MNATDLISECLISVHVRLITTSKDLTNAQLLWRPTPIANHIGFILWHMNRHQDTQITRTAASGEDLWITDGWFNRFSQDPDSPDPGDRLGLRALPIPSLDVLLGYSEAVHKRTMAFVSGLDSNQLDHPLTDGIENYSVGNCLRHLITHQNNHHGQIDYIRGLQDEKWDLPTGTGVRLDSYL